MMEFVTRLVVLGLLVYFAAHAVSGDHGLVRWMSLQSQEERLGRRLAELEKEKSRLEAYLVRLREDSLDLDHLDYLARSRLAMVSSGQIVLHDDDGHWTR